MYGGDGKRTAVAWQAVLRYISTKADSQVRSGGLACEWTWFEMSFVQGDKARAITGSRSEEVALHRSSDWA